MANDPSLKFVLEVDDKGKVKFKRFGEQVDKTSMAGGRFGAKMKVVSLATAKVATSMVKATAKAALFGAGLAAAGAAFVAKKSIGEFASFETALARTGNVTTASLESIKQKIFEMDSSLGNATELVQGYYNVLSAGVTEPKKAIALLTTSSQLAKEAHIEHSESVKGLASLMSTYSDELKTAADASDLLYSIEKSGITTISELIPLAGNLANQSKLLGLSANEMAAAWAQMTKAGQGTAKATTQLEGILRGLAKPTADMTELLGKYGGAQEAVRKLGFAGVLREIMKVTQGNAESMNKFFGRTEAVSGVVQLAKANFTQLATSMDTMKDKTGAGSEAWDRYEATLSSIWDTFKSTVSNQAILIGEKLAPAIKTVLEQTGDWLNTNRDMITQGFGDFIQGIGTDVANLWKWIKETSAATANWAKENVNLLKVIRFIVDDLGDLATALVSVGSFFGRLVGGNKEVQAELIRTKKAFDTLEDVQALVSFFGKASPKKPLLETIGNVIDATDRMRGDMEAPIDVTADISSATAEIIDFSERASRMRADAETAINVTANTSQANNAIAGTASGFDVLVSAASSAAGKISTFFGSVFSKVRSLLSSISSAKSSIETLGSTDVTVDFFTKASPKKPFEKGIEDINESINGMRANMEIPIEITADASQAFDEFSKVREFWQGEIAATRLALSRLDFGLGQGLSFREQADIVAAYNADISRAKGKLASVPTGSFHEGTGVSGLPKTGLFMGHQGEIVLNPKESQDMRDGNTGNTVNVTISPMFMTGDQEGMRAAAKMIIPEIERELRRAS